MKSGPRLSSVLVLAVVTLAGCRKQAEEAVPPEPSRTPVPAIAAAKPSPPPSADPNALHGMPGALGITSEEAPVELAAATAFKNHGKLGERLEGDVYRFEVVAMARCGAPPDGAPVPAGRAVIAAKVRIQAKSRLAVSPRDVILHRDGVTFYASLDPERRLKGCTPLLKFASLREKQVSEGYVLFDVPELDPKGFELLYRPTRWGGASPVRVALESW